MKDIFIKIKELFSKISDKLGSNKTSMLVAFLVTLIFGFINLILGIVVGCVVSLAKEIYDWFRLKKYGEGEGFSKTDLHYDIVGIIIAVIILLLV